MTLENSSQSTILNVIVSYGELKAEFSGAPEVVLKSVNAFVAKQLPEIDLAKRLHVNFSAKDLVEKFESYVKITPEGPRVWSVEKKLSDKELVALQLVAQKIASETSDKTNSPAMSLSFLQETISLNPKSLSSRLSELSKSGYVARETSPEGTTFTITTQGIDWLSNTLSKKA